MCVCSFRALCPDLHFHDAGLRNPVLRELFSVVDRFQLHTVVIHDAELRHCSRLASYQRLRNLLAIQPFKLFRVCRAVDGQIVLSPDLLQIAEVRNDRHFACAERQVDQLVRRTKAESLRRSRKLQQLILVEALQLFAQPI